MVRLKCSFCKRKSYICNKTTRKDILSYAREGFYMCRKCRINLVLRELEKLKKSVE